MEVSAIYRQLGALLSIFPDLRSVDETMQIPTTTIDWLAKASALVEAMPGVSLDSMHLQAAIDNLIQFKGRAPYPTQIRMVLSRVLARAELLSPASTRGAFVSAGDSFDALAAVSKILSSATSSILIVDPYMDDRVLSDFAVLAAEKILLSFLTDEATVKPSFAPALKRWNDQYGTQRPAQARLAASKTLHDRLIFIDSAQAWILTQSLKDFAARSPATIQRADAELSQLKFDSYSSIWTASVPVTI